MPSKGRPRGAKQVSTPLKSQISRYFNKLGGSETRGAAAKTARKFGLSASNGPKQVLLYDTQVLEGTASRSNRPHTGRSKGLTEGVKQNIIDLFNETDTLTYKDGAKKLGISKSTLHDYATKDMDYRCLSQIMRPMLRDPNIERRMEMSPDIVAAPAPLTDEFHQDEKWFKINTRRKKRKVRKSDKPGAQKVVQVVNRTHDTKVMFTGCPGVGPDGQPLKIDLEWVSKVTVAKKNSRNRPAGTKVLESTTMDREYFTNGDS